MSERGLQEALEKMRADGAPDVAVRNFRDAYERLVGGETGMLPERDIEPVTDIPALDDLPEPGEQGRRALDRAIVLRLNGGMGTSMGLERAKSLIEVKEGLSFLDIIARQVLRLRERFDVRLPLVLMNSFYTREDSLEALERYPELRGDIPLDFVQGRIPKITDDDDMRPVGWDDDASREWTPPGHGDLYTSLQTSGMLETLLEHDYEYAFLSNSDNLGAVVDPHILAWFAAEEIPFLMEVTRRTDADRKGGHIARRDKRFLLRETAQTPEEDLSELQDTSRHRYLNTNNLWVNLRALDAVMRERDGVLGLPMIVNRKTVDPGDKSSTPVIQLETAMGAAIGVFEGARALEVPRRRFSPVKTTEDLLGLRSDAYVLTDEAHVVLAPERDGAPVVADLDDDHFKRLRDFEDRIQPSDTPSLIACERITVVGDVAFGREVVVRGTVRIEQAGDEQLRIEDGSVLEG